MAVVAKAKGKAPIKPAPKLAPHLRYIWAIYCDLDATRDIGMALGPLPYREIEAFARLTNTKLTPFEVGAIRALDRAFMEHRVQAQKQEKRP